MYVCMPVCLYSMKRIQSLFGTSAKALCECIHTLDPEHPNRSNHCLKAQYKVIASPSASATDNNGTI